MSVFDILVAYREGLLRGLTVTLQLAAITWVVGLSFGSLIGAAASRWEEAVGGPLTMLTFLLSGIPFLVLLYWTHFPLQMALGVVIDPFITAASVLSLMNALIVASVWRSALRDFREEYVLAAKVCGMNEWETIWYIQFPLTLRQALPTLLAVQVAMLQMTLFASLISVDELFRTAQEINSEIYRPIEIYTALAVFFIVICVPLYGIAFWLRVKFTRNLSER